MPAWVRYSRKRLVYAGRITRRSFAAWTETPDGRAAVDTIAETIRLAPFRRIRARQRLWRELSAAARDEAVVAALQAEVELYLARLGSLAYSPGLPRDSVLLRRLVVVPHVLLNGDTYSSLETRLGAQPGFTSLRGGEALREFFVLKLIDDLDAAARRARLSPRHPHSAGSGWISVGLNSTFEWHVPATSGPAWSGHHYVLELTREPMTRRVRTAVATSVARLEASLPTLSRLERSHILRLARYAA